MIKLFCDGCGEQIDDTANRTIWSLEGVDPVDPDLIVDVEVEVIVSINAMSNNGHICESCIKRVIKDGNPRKRNTR